MSRASCGTLLMYICMTVGYIPRCGCLFVFYQYDWLIVEFDTATLFLSRSKHVKGTTKYQFFQEAKTEQALFQEVVKRGLNTVFFLEIYSCIFSRMKYKIKIILPLSLLFHLFYLLLPKENLLLLPFLIFLNSNSFSLVFFFLFYCT